jgi:hypothetical protein
LSLRVTTLWLLILWVLYIPCIYDDAYYLKKDGVFVVSKKGKYGTLDRKGKTLIPCCKESEQDVRNLY